MAISDVGFSARDASTVAELGKRILIPLTPTSPPGLVEANTVDPWSKAGKYALGWTYFCLVLVFLVTVTRLYHLWTDKLRQAMFKEEVEKRVAQYAPEADFQLYNLHTNATAEQLFPRIFPHEGEKPYGEVTTSHWSSIGVVNDTLALFRWIFYRPVPELKWKKKTILSFPSLAVIAILLVALMFVTLYCFLPQPLYWQSIRFGSPPLAIRAGMIAIAMTPWIIATSMKANLISMLTGIGHDRLGVFHRWGGYLCLFLSLVHTIPFYIQPVWDDGGMTVFSKLFPPGSGIIYGSGIACLVPLCWLCVMSLPIIRSKLYELFVLLHIPVAMIYVGVLFWHCKNFLTSWSYLYATLAIWVLSYFLRLFNLNWLKPWRNAWVIGDEAAVTLMAENAIKVTIPTQMKWRPGQYIYLRMPGISIFENHPFTISSLCSEDFPSEYGDEYRDCTLVFRPFGGFTRKVLETAIEKGPMKTYRAYLDGPYGGMQRELAAFETVILLAGGSGITAIVSQLLNLIKRMRDGKAVTKKVVVIWALKRLEAMDWFREELRICRESAPLDTVTCQFFVTAAKRQTRMGVSERAPRPISNILHDKLDGFVAGIASKRNSALIRDEAQGDPERERELRAEDEDAITALPRPKHLQPRVHGSAANYVPTFPPPPKKEIARHESLKKLEGRHIDLHETTRKFLAPFSSKGDDGFHFPPPSPRHDAPHFQFAPPSPHPNGPQDYPPESSVPFTQPPEPAHLRQGTGDLQIQIPNQQPPSSGFDFGFPTTPTEFQKNLMRFAFVGQQKKEGWTTEYGRPDLGYMLKEMATGGADGKGIFGRRTCVFVCGPPSMRVDVANTVARLQADIWGDDSKDEIFLHTENYAI
ncbi:ferric reductase like transmembrane component-domain-containing protein [Xylogone sp. PMI_703]|nr:ferric reductase like transmembrane component-domain-containing protein [Xylogone sp. PMI_703]